jgi:tRNA1Val (adenine37-N6)-methyltransferase
VFRFKQFQVQQHHAFKVGTDGVLLGAWCDVSNSHHILDIGTGTGLIALMLAQRSKAHITAIEKSEKSCEDANLNFSLSPWQKKIQLFQQDFLEFYQQHDKKYDLIVSNPPYFINSQKSGNENKNLARHQDHLPFQQLVSGVSKLLNDEGRFSFILPILEADLLIKEAEKYQLFPSKITYVKTTPNKLPSRKLVSLQRKKIFAIENTLIIEQFRHHYSDDFKSLVADFYL